MQRGSPRRARHAVDLGVAMQQRAAELGLLFDQQDALARRRGGRAAARPAGPAPTTSTSHLALPCAAPVAGRRRIDPAEPGQARMRARSRCQFGHMKVL